MDKNYRSVFKTHSKRYRDNFEGWEICNDGEMDLPANQTEDFGVSFLQRKCKYFDRSNIVLSPHFFCSTTVPKDKTALSDPIHPSQDNRVPDHSALSPDRVNCITVKNKNLSSTITLPERCTFRYVQASMTDGNPSTSGSDAMQKVKRLIYITNSSLLTGKNTVQTSHILTASSHDLYKDQTLAVLTPRLWEIVKEEVPVKKEGMTDAHCGTKNRANFDYREVIAKLREQQINNLRTQVRSGGTTPWRPGGPKIAEQLGGRGADTHADNWPKEVRSSPPGGNASPSTEEQPHVFGPMPPPRASQAHNGQETRKIRRLRRPQSHPSVWSRRKLEPSEAAQGEEGQTKSDTTSVLTFVGKKCEPRAPRQFTADRCHATGPFSGRQLYESDAVVPSENLITFGDVLKVMRDDDMKKKTRLNQHAKFKN